MYQWDPDVYPVDLRHCSCITWHCLVCPLQRNRYNVEFQSEMPSGWTNDHRDCYLEPFHHLPLPATLKHYLLLIGGYIWIYCIYCSIMNHEGDKRSLSAKEAYEERWGLSGWSVDLNCILIWSFRNYEKRREADRIRKAESVRAHAITVASCSDIRRTSIFVESARSSSWHQTKLRR